MLSGHCCLGAPHSLHADIDASLLQEVSQLLTCQTVCHSLQPWPVQDVMNARYNTCRNARQDASIEMHALNPLT